MNQIMDFLVTTYLGGLACIILGIIAISIIFKFPTKEEDQWFAGDLKGWFAGVGFIVLGILVILLKLFGVL